LISTKISKSVQCVYEHHKQMFSEPHAGHGLPTLGLDTYALLKHISIWTFCAIFKYNCNWCYFI